MLIEARAFGCAVGTHVGGIPSSIIDGVDGLIVEPEDAAGLKDALLHIARDPQLRGRLVTAGIERARQSSIEDLC